MCLQRPRNEIYLITTIQVNTLQLFTGVERPSNFFFETITDLSEAQKTIVFQALKTHYRSTIFQKMTNSAFSCNKNGLVSRGVL